MVGLQDLHHITLISSNIDRLYFADPDGVILEIATRGPGFLVDEDRDELGTHFFGPGESPSRPTGVGAR